MEPTSKTGRSVLLLHLILTIFALVTVRLALAAERSSKPAPVRMGIVSRSTLDMPFFVAQDRGFFREEGLEPELVLMRASLTPQALLGGSIDFGTATGTAVSAAQRLKPAPAVTPERVFDFSFARKAGESLR